MAERFMVGAPVVSQGLAVYPIRRDEEPRDVPRILTLPEALDAGHAVMHETGRVRQLALKVTGDVPVMCLMGDLVIGGRQDRLVAADALVLRRSGQVRLPAYCVERVSSAP
jgi:hypothetical protein